MEPIDLGGHVEEQLQLGEEGEVVRGDVGVWAAGDIVLYEPVVVQRAQDAQHVQLRLRVENIVNDTLEERKRRRWSTSPNSAQARETYSDGCTLHDWIISF